MGRPKLAVAVFSIVTISGFVACMPDQGDLVGSKSKDDSSPADNKSEAVECGGPTLSPQDPSKFPKCSCKAGGQARCIGKDKVPASVSSKLDSCSEGGPGVCVPDPLVKSGGAAPPTCKSAFGEGRCMSLCVPDVAKNASLLNR